MDSLQSLPNLTLARLITESFFDDDNPHLGIEAFYMFSVSKFILLKERIIKKDSINNILYFDNKKYRGYISIIMEFYKHITETGTFKRNNTIVELSDDSMRTQELENAIWCFNKIRDALAHGRYTFDFNRKGITINNVAQDNSYFLNCTIPINLLNSFTFFVEEIIKKDDDKSIGEQYKKYIKIMSKDFDIDSDYYYNEYIFNYDFKNNYYNNINRVKSLKYNNDLYDEKNSELDNRQDNNDLFMDKIIDFILSSEIEQLSIEKLKELAKLLWIKKPRNQNEKDKILKLLNEFKVLLRQYSEEKDQKVFSEKTEDLILEMQKILGIKSGCKNPNGIISLYNYMSLVFSQTEEIDYSKLKIHPMLISFNPRNRVEGSAINYFNTIESIKRKCEEFNNRMESHISNYGNNQSQNYRHSLMDNFANFYIKIMESLGIKNSFIMDSVRNAIEHGNYKYNQKGYVFMYDQPDHNDDNTIKFVAATKPKELFDIIKQIESSKDEEFLLGDFVQQLSPILGNELFERTWNNLNELSNIIFGKELNLDYTMDQMYQEAIATIISCVSRR